MSVGGGDLSIYNSFLFFSSLLEYKISIYYVLFIDGNVPIILIVHENKINYLQVFLVVFSSHSYLYNRKRGEWN